MENYNFNKKKSKTSLNTCLGKKEHLRHLFYGDLRDGMTKTRQNFPINEKFGIYSKTRSHFSNRIFRETKVLEKCQQPTDHFDCFPEKMQFRRRCFPAHV